MNIQITIENGEHFFDVQLEGELETIDDTFDHEFGTAFFQPYSQLKEFPTWNHDLYSEPENWLIAIHLYYNFLSIEKSFVELEETFINDFINEYE